MKSRILMVLAVFGLLCSGIALAQDGGLGKKGGGKSGGSGSGKSGGDKGAPPPQRGGGGGQVGGDKSTPPPQRGGGGGQVGGAKGAPPPQRGGGGGGGQVGGGGSGDGLGKKGGGSGGSSGGGQVGRGGGSSGGGQVGRGGGSSGGGQVGRGGGDIPLGRPDRQTGGVRNDPGTILGRPQRQGDSGDFSLGKRSGPSRSGTVKYTGDHNLAGVGRVSPSVINNVPVVTSNTRILREGHRENRVQVIDTRYRSGYCHYDRGWQDSYFYYPWYGFNYYDGCNYIPSPFYYYQHLPGYIDCVRVSIGPITWTSCRTRYDWYMPRYDSYGYGYDRYNDFDYCVGDISRAFENRSLRYLSHLIPTRGRVEIDMGYGDQYSLNSDDFYDMMRDLVEGTRTTRYRIEDVYRDGNRATVTAIHEFDDPWGREEYVRHTYGLRSTGRGYEIVYFRSDRA